MITDYRKSVLKVSPEAKINVHDLVASLNECLGEGTWQALEDDFAFEDNEALIYPSRIHRGKSLRARGDVALFMDIEWDHLVDDEELSDDGVDDIDYVDDDSDFNSSLLERLESIAKSLSPHIDSGFIEISTISHESSEMVMFRRIRIEADGSGTWIQSDFGPGLVSEGTVELRYEPHAVDF